jgi:two-component system cell cycle response regulator
VGGKRILIVDDNPVILKLLRTVLDGYEVRTATSAEGALEVLRAFRPQLILMDIHLRTANGLDLTRRLRADPWLRDVTILAFTGGCASGEEQDALNAGCDGYLLKPMDLRSLPSVVEGYLRRSARAAG